jgi:PAS domain S-box-containing protein
MEDAATYENDSLGERARAACPQDGASPRVDRTAVEVLDLLTDRCVVLAAVDGAHVSVEPFDCHLPAVGTSGIAGPVTVGSFPLCDRGRIVGTLTLTSQRQHELSAAEAATVQALADLTAVAIIERRAALDARFTAARLVRAMNAQTRMDGESDLPLEPQMSQAIDRHHAALLDAADGDPHLRLRLAAVVSGAREPLVAVDERGCVTEFNRAAEALVGCSAETARGRQVGDVLRVESSAGENVSARLRSASVAEWQLVGTLTSQRGQPVPVAISAGPLHDENNEAAGGMLVFRDLRS